MTLNTSSNPGISPPWCQYPVGIRNDLSNGYDLIAIRKSLEAKAENIFVQDEAKIKLEAVHYTEDYGGYVGTAFSNVLDFERFVMAQKRKHESIYFILSQMNSWSRLKLLSSMFYLLCYSFDISPILINFVTDFCKRIQDLSGYYVLCQHHFLLVPNTNEIKTFELCYNIRYFALHGRDLEDPWSCRSCCLYQQCHVDTNYSVWLSIQLPQECRDVLERNFRDASDMQSSSSIAQSIYTHMRVLALFQNGWRDYLDYLEGALHVKTANMSSPLPYKAYKINISLTHDLQHLRGKIRRAIVIINGNINVINNILDFSTSLHRQSDPREDTYVHLELQLKNLIRNYENHSERARRLLESSNDSWTLTFKILELHQSELSRETELNLEKIANVDSGENKELVKMTTQTHRDSRIMAIAAVIAVAYLPATLIASMFSANMIPLESWGPRWGIFILGSVILLTMTGVSGFFIYTRGTNWRAGVGANRLP